MTFPRRGVSLCLAFVLMSLASWPLPVAAVNDTAYIDASSVVENLPAMTQTQAGWDLGDVTFVQSDGLFLSGATYANGLAQATEMPADEAMEAVTKTGLVIRYINRFSTDLTDDDVSDDFRVVAAITLFEDEDGASAFLDLPLPLAGVQTELDAPAIGDDASLIAVANDIEDSPYPANALTLHVRDEDLVVSIVFSQPSASEMDLMEPDIIERQAELQLDRIAAERQDPTPTESNLTLRAEPHEHISPMEVYDTYIALDGTPVNLWDGSIDDAPNTNAYVRQNDIVSEYQTFFYLREDEAETADASLSISLVTHESRAAADGLFENLLDNNGWVDWGNGDATEIEDLPAGVRGFALPYDWPSAGDRPVIFLYASDGHRGVLFQIGSAGTIDMDVALDLMDRQLACLDLDPGEVCGTFDADDLFTR